ncbi:MAG: hypothetical protein ACM3SV_10940 [Betaproteobacteria bacterium]
MSAIHPIGQRVTCLEDPEGADFVRKVRELLVGNEDIALEAASNEELIILAQSEIDLAGPRGLLRAVFGDAIQFSAPAARLLYSDGWQQPIMGFRIAAPSSILRLIETSLALRGASITDVEVRDSGAVLRGQGPQAALIGYPRILSRLSRGSAHAAFWLSGYQPLWSYSNETATCYQE